MNKKTLIGIVIILLVAYFIPLDRCRCTLLELLQGKRNKPLLGGCYPCKCRLSLESSRTCDPCASQGKIQYCFSAGQTGRDPICRCMTSAEIQAYKDNPLS